MTKTFLVFLILKLIIITCYGANVNRIKRGFLSRTGVCPEPSRNFQKRDRRLNYFGNAIVLKKGNKDVTCIESECIEDSHCDADRKCCKNHCGGMVCTRSVRDPDPCENFQCPADQTCKIQRVKCVMPKCQDTYAVNRPTCVPKSEATALLNDDKRIATETSTESGNYGQQNYGQPHYGNYYEQTTGSPQASYYATNQQYNYGNGQVPSWPQTNYQTQQG